MTTSLIDDDSNRAMRLSAAALSPSGPSPASRSWAKPTAAIASGPSETFIRRSRNPDLESPRRFEPTPKQPGDVVL